MAGTLACGRPSRRAQERAPQDEVDVDMIRTSEALPKSRHGTAPENRENESEGETAREAVGGVCRETRFRPHPRAEAAGRVRRDRRVRGAEARCAQASL